MVFYCVSPYADVQFNSVPRTLSEGHEGDSEIQMNRPYADYWE